MTESDQALTSLRIARRTRIANDIHAFELRDPHGGDLAAFTPGSHVVVRAPNGALRKAIADPFVGIEYSHPLGERWHVNARADYGGFNLESKSQAHVLATFGYRFSDRLAAFGGYRYLKVDFQSTREVLRLTAGGPAIGFSWSW